MKFYTEADLDRQRDISRRIHSAMDDETDYDMLVAVMSAHVQRMICNKAGNRAEEARQLLDSFHVQCVRKVKHITELAEGRAA